MPEFAFEVEKPNGSTTEYLTRGPSLTGEEAVERAYDRYPEGRIKRKLYGGDTSDVDLSNPDLSDDAASDATGVTDEADDEQELDEVRDPLADADADAEEWAADDDTDEEPEPEDESMVPPPIDPAAFTVEEIRSELAERDLSDAQLRGLRVSEEGGENRVTVIGEIDERLGGDDE